MNIIAPLLLGIIIGYIIGDWGNKTRETRTFLKTKLYDLIGHNLALEQGYDCLKNFRSKKRITWKESANLKGEDLDNHIRSQHLQQSAKIVFASGMLRELDEKDFVKEQWKKYGIKLSRDKNYIIYKKI